MPDPASCGLTAEMASAVLGVTAPRQRLRAGREALGDLLKRSRLVRASLQTISAGLIAQGLLLVSGALSARMLGVDGRGALASLTLWPLIVILLGNLGVPVACTFFLRERPERAAEVWAESLRWAFGQSVVLTILAGGVVLAVSDVQQPGMPAAVAMTSAMVPLMVLQRYGLALLQGRERYGAYNVLRILPNALYSLAVTVLFVRGVESLGAVIGANLCAYLVACAATMARARRELAPRWRRVPGMRRDLLSFGLRGHLGAVAPVDGLRIDQVVVALCLDARALGLYVAAYAFTNLPRFIAESASRVALPAVADLEGRSAQVRLVWRFFWGVTVIMVPVTLGLLLVMPRLVSLCFGPAFLPAVPIARILLVGATLVGWRRILVEGLRGLGQPAVSTVAELAMYPWLLLTGPFLIHFYGAAGLAISLATGYGLSLAVSLQAMRTAAGASAGTGAM